MAAVPAPRPTFMLLPKDIFPRICDWLSVRDILALRRVNKALCALTHTAGIWLSLLRRLTLALPPAQPVPPDASGRHPPHTLEALVARALKLERNWRDCNPLAAHYRFDACQRTLCMRFLPGGRWMVAVAHDAAARRESVVVWDMSYRGRRSHVAVAMLDSETPVRKLQARYAQVRGQVSLVVAFTRPPADGKTAVAVTAITVELLENLCSLGPGSAAFAEYGRRVPNPFTKLLETRTRYPVGALSLADVEGQPVLATVHRPRTIAFEFLGAGTRASLKLAAVPGYDQWRHSIWDIKLLPAQNQILVIRVLIGAVHAMGTTPLVLELHDLPPAGAADADAAPAARQIVPGHAINGFYVSDADAAWWARTHRDPCVHRLARCAPPPVSVFVTTKAPRGLLHLVLRGRGRAGAYALPAGPRALHEWDEDEQAVVLPGAYRAVVWMRAPRRQPQEGVEVLRLAVYRTEGCAFSDAGDAGAGGDAAGDGAGAVGDGAGAVMDGAGARVERPERRCMKFPAMPEEVARAMRGGTWCLQFDEWLGRLCVATTQDNWIHVLDWSI